MLFSGVLIQMIASSLKRVVHIAMIMSDSIKQQSYFSISIKLKRLKKLTQTKMWSCPAQWRYTLPTWCVYSHWSFLVLSSPWNTSKRRTTGTPPRLKWMVSSLIVMECAIYIIVFYIWYLRQHHPPSTPPYINTTLHQHHPPSTPPSINTTLHQHALHLQCIFNMDREKPNVIWVFVHPIVFVSFEWTSFLIQLTRYLKLWPFINMAIGNIVM